MVAATTQPVERQRLLRFDAAERALHWVNAAVFLTVMGTAAILYVVGHIGFALADPDSLGSMLRGPVNARWAREHHPRWYKEETGSDPQGVDGDLAGHLDPGG